MNKKNITKITAVLTAAGLGMTSLLPSMGMLSTFAADTVQASQATDTARVSSTVITGLVAKYTGKNITAGQSPSKADFSVTATYTDTYTDGSTKIRDEALRSNDFAIAGSTDAGINAWSITYTYGGKTVAAAADVTFVTATVKRSVLDGITATYTGGKLKTGQVPQKKDFSVKADYTDSMNDGTTKKRTNVTLSTLEYSVSGDNSKAGENTWTVTAGNSVTGTKTANVIIVFEENTPATSVISAITASYKGEDVIEGKQPSKSDIYVVATYTDTYEDKTVKTRSKLLEDADFTIAGDTSAGENTWTVTAGNQKTTVKITFVKASDNNNADGVDGGYSDDEYAKWQKAIHAGEDDEDQDNGGSGGNSSNSGTGTVPSGRRINSTAKPAVPSGVKLSYSKKTKKLTVTWKRNRNKNVFYQVQKTISGKSSKKNVDGKKTTLKVTKGKTVKIRVRAYYTNTSGKKITGIWSKTVSKKIG